MRRVRPIYILRFLRLLLDPNSNKEQIKTKIIDSQYFWDGIVEHGSRHLVLPAWRDLFRITRGPYLILIVWLVLDIIHLKFNVRKFTFFNMCKKNLDINLRDIFSRTKDNISTRSWLANDRF